MNDLPPADGLSDDTSPSADTVIQEKTPESASGVFFSAKSGESCESGPRHSADYAAFESAGLWRANALTTGQGPVCATGYAALDACLPGGGWSVAGLTEVLTATHGVGELGLIMPALAALTESQPGWVMWVAPPFLPNAPALQQWGLCPSRVLVIHPRTPRDVAWSAEQALTSDNCVAILLWSGIIDHARGNVSFVRLSRRLQLAATEHQCWVIAFREAQHQKSPTAAMLRLAIHRADDQCDVQLIKVRGGRPAMICGLDLHKPGRSTPEWR